MLGSLKLGLCSKGKTEFGFNSISQEEAKRSLQCTVNPAVHFLNKEVDSICSSGLNRSQTLQTVKDSVTKLVEAKVTSKTIQDLPKESGKNIGMSILGLA